MELHQVTLEELPALNRWLKGHLPESWKCPTLFQHLRFKCVYGPDPEDIETILQRHIEWTKPFTFHVTNETSRSIIHRLAKEKDLEYCQDVEVYLMQASPGDIEARPIPEGFKLRPIDPDTEAEYCAGTWWVQTPATVDYFKALVARLPNACLANRDNECVCFELGTDYGTIGMLHTHEDYRRRGLGNVLVSNLVQEYFKDGLPAVACVELTNDPSIQMHLSLGFTIADKLVVVVCFPKDFKDKEKDYVYKSLQTSLEK